MRKVLRRIVRLGFLLNLSPFKILASPPVQPSLTAVRALVHPNQESPGPSALQPPLRKHRRTRARMCGIVPAQKLYAKAATLQRRLLPSSTCVKSLPRPSSSTERYGCDGHAKSFSHV